MHLRVVLVIYTLYLNPHVTYHFKDVYKEIIMWKLVGFVGSSSG